MIYVNKYGIIYKIERYLLQITTKGDYKMITIANVKEQLRKTREVCPDLSEGVYSFMDYMSYMTNDTLVPEGLEMAIKLCLCDIFKQQNNSQSEESQECFKYLINRPAEEVLEYVSYIPKIVDKLASKEFAEEFKKQYKQNSAVYPMLLMFQ